MEDKQYLTAIDEIARELQSTIVEYNRRSNGNEDKTALIELRLEQMTVLEANIKKYRRTLAFLAGEKVEPQMQFAEAILIGVGNQT